MSEPLILVADDSREIRSFLEENVLVPAGYLVRSAEDGLSALTLAREIKPDLLITDQQMPNLTGIELIQQLKRELPHLPAILITSEGSEPLVVEALRAGAVDYLTKPFEAEHLLAAVGRALTERRRWESLVEARSEAQASAEDLASRLRALEALTLVGRTVTSLLDLDEVLTTVVEAAVRLTGAEEGSLLLVDDESGELYMRASKNFDEEFARTFRLHVRDSLAGQVIVSGEPALIDESSPQKDLTSSLVHSLIYVPLRLRGKVIGVLGVDNRKAGLSLTNEDRDMMMAMADYAAVAIENAQLFQRSELERNKLETILTQSENGVIVTDPEDRLLLINHAAMQAFGVDGRLVGKPVVEIFEDEKLISLLCTKGKLPHMDEIEVDPGRFYSAQRTPIEEVGQVIVFHNITHLKELDRIKSEFVTTVSHDLRSPLTAVLGYLELIERAGSVNEQQGEFIHRAQMSVTQITDLVNDLLELGRVEAGLDIAKEDTPLTVLARYAIEGLRGSAEAKEITLEVNLQEFAPLVNGDPVRLRQMIGNLLDNAIKYTPENGVVRLAVEAEGDQVILRISDTGMGIPQADQPYLFDKFFRASNIPEDLPGTGLGLSIVKSIVDNHGGRIWVDSKSGEGATFTVVLQAVET
jgi:signal transduction histidine kinase/DNA-binding response OmpR family regulator